MSPTDSFEAVVATDLKFDVHLNLILILLFLIFNIYVYYICLKFLFCC